MAVRVRARSFLLAVNAPLVRAVAAVLKPPPGALEGAALAIGRRQLAAANLAAKHALDQVQEQAEARAEAGAGAEAEVMASAETGAGAEAGEGEVEFESGGLVVDLEAGAPKILLPLNPSGPGGVSGGGGYLGSDATLLLDPGEFVLCGGLGGGALASRGMLSEWLAIMMGACLFIQWQCHLCRLRKPKPKPETQRANDLHTARVCDSSCDDADGARKDGSDAWG